MAANRKPTRENAVVGKLTAHAVESAPLAPRGTTSRLSDGNGLFLLCTDAAKGWRFRYTKPGGKDAMLSLGVYPAVSLDDARAKAVDYRKRLAQGENLVEVKRADQAEADLALATFGQAALEYNKRRADGKTKENDLSAKTLDRDRRNFETYSAKLHKRPISAITRRELLDVCEATANDTPDSGNRLAKWITNVFAYAVDRGYLPEDKPVPTQRGGALTGDLRKASGEHHPALTDPRQVGALMRVLDSSDWLLTAGCTPSVARALQLLARTVVRANELVGAQWSEFDLTGKSDPRNKGRPTWVVPRERMKGGKRGKHVTDHAVPLSRQAVAILEAQHAVSGHLKYVFPGFRSPSTRHMTPNAIPAAMVALGFRDVQTAHGLRTTFATLARDVLKAQSEIIERQLAHRVGSSVSQAYDQATRLDQRRPLMQKYSDLLDTLRDAPTGRK